MFVDEADIYVRGGKGGHGCVSFRRERFIPHGGPDGGNGGDGGSVHILAVPGLDTLLDLINRRHWIAQNGRPGQGSNRHGRRGRSLTVEVPVGTLVYDSDKQALLKDLTQPDQKILVAAGGRGGQGNKAFATPTNQAPREAGPGQPGEQRHLHLELKLIADVGIVGLPNAGKSTLLSRLSRARPKIADYPFTTTHPQLGIVELSDQRRFVMADLPGLIEGAHRGVGLGDAFLRHIERTRLILHLIDIAPGDGQPAPDQAYHVIRRELHQYSPTLAAKPELIVANKMDLTGSLPALHQLRQSLQAEILPTSALTGEALDRLLERLWQCILQARADNTNPAEAVPPPEAQTP